MNDFILAYYQAIQDGSVIVGKWIRKWYAQIVKNLQKGVYKLDVKKANRAIRFVERYCRHHEGALAPQLIKLELWQKALLSVLFGIVDEDGKRQFHEAIIVIGRKNGKTLLCAAIAAYIAYIDEDYGKRIYFCAPKLDQAALCYDGLYQMILKEPELEALAKKRRTDIYIEESNTSAKPIAFSAKKSDGLNPSLCICDEIAAWQGAAGLKQYEVFTSALGAREQPLILSISTAGYINDGIYDELIRRGTSVINGGSKEKRLAAFLYTIDDVDKWNDINELKKANPNLGVSVSVDHMLEEIAVAEGSLSKRVEFLVKYCNIKQNSSSAWLEYTAVDKICGEQLNLEDFAHSYCVGGIDLSQTTDLTSCCVVIEKNKRLYVFSQFFMPRNRVEIASAEDGVPYEIFVKQGILTLSGEHHVDYKDCYAWFTKLIEQHEILPLVCGYDRYSAQYLVDDMKRYGFKMDDVYQGFNLAPVIRELQGVIYDRKINIGKNNLLKAHLLNTALKQDMETQKVRIAKLGTRTRIDGCAALLDAMCVRQKWYAEIGEMLKNEE